MFQNEKHVGQVFQGVAGVLTALTVLATVIFTLLGVFGAVDMEAIRVQSGALAYVVAVGSFSLRPSGAPGRPTFSKPVRNGLWPVMNAAVA